MAQTAQKRIGALVANTYFSIDRARRVSGVVLSQLRPVCGATAVVLFARFETEVHRAP